MIPLRDTRTSNSKPTVTILIILANILVFLYTLSLDGYTQNHFVATYAMVPAHMHLSTLLSSLFLHAGWMHLIGNMWFLWVFGDNVEDVLGHGKYLGFYLACGVLASLAQYAMSPYSRIPTLGASGAIAGVMGAYLVKFPRNRILTLLPIIIFWTTIDVPAWLILIYWFGLQFLGVLGTSMSQGGGVAFFAHIGGFIAGMILDLHAGDQAALFAAARSVLAMTVTLYTRAGCHLCDEARHVIQSVRPRQEFHYEEFDIDTDPSLRRLYNEEVPVIAIDGKKAFKYRLTSEDLIQKLKARS